MPPTTGDRLLHILEAILSIEDLLAGKTQADVLKNRHLRLSLEREMEIISEASRRIPEELKAQGSKIDWTGMAALGNRLRHAYHRVDVDILFEIKEKDMPPLKVFIEHILSDYPDHDRGSP